MAATFENFTVQITNATDLHQNIPHMTLDARFTLLNQERDAIMNTESLNGSEIPTSESFSELDAVVDHWAPHPLNTYSDFSSECSYDACYPDVDMSDVYSNEASSCSSPESGSFLDGEVL